MAVNQRWTRVCDPIAPIGSVALKRRMPPAAVSGMTTGDTKVPACVLRFDSTQAGTFVSPVVIPDTAAGGILRFNATDPIGAIGSQTLVHLWFTAMGPGASNQVLSLPVLTAAVTGLDLRPGLLVAPGGATIGP